MKIPLLRSSRFSSPAVLKSGRVLPSIVLAVIGSAFLFSSSSSSAAYNISRQLQDQQGHVPLHVAASPSSDRPLHLLSLGGSVTWGAMLDERTDAYPSVLASSMLPPNSTATNIAIRAIGADYGAMCLQTMVLEGHAEQHPHLVDANGGHDIEYDIITVEYSINGIGKLDLLLSRLRNRYPHSIIIYIHIYSWQANVVEEKSRELAVSMRNKIWQETNNFPKAQELVSNLVNDPSHQWTWSNDARHKAKNRAIRQTIKSEIQNVNGFFYELPKENNASHALDWFASDLHHLNKAGHQRIAYDVANMIDIQKNVPSSYPTQATTGWEDGPCDHCISWYRSGAADQIHINKDVVPFATNKFAVEVTIGDKGPLLFEFYNPFGVKMPLALSMMSHGKVYPKAVVTVRSKDKEEIVLANPRIGVLLDPLNRDPEFRVHHVVQSQFIGYAEPGANVIYITPIETTEEPLRITGLVLCRQCGLEEMVP